LKLKSHKNHKTLADVLWHIQLKTLLPPPISIPGSYIRPRRRATRRTCAWVARHRPAHHPNLAGNLAL